MGPGNITPLAEIFLVIGSRLVELNNTIALESAFDYRLDSWSHGNAR